MTHNIRNIIQPPMDFWSRNFSPNPQPEVQHRNLNALAETASTFEEQPAQRTKEKVVRTKEKMHDDNRNNNTTTTVRKRTKVITSVNTPISSPQNEQAGRVNNLSKRKRVEPSPEQEKHEAEKKLKKAIKERDEARAELNNAKKPRLEEDRNVQKLVKQNLELLELTKSAFGMVTQAGRSSNEFLQRTSPLFQEVKRLEQRNEILTAENDLKSKEVRSIRLQIGQQHLAKAILEGENNQLREKTKGFESQIEVLHGFNAQLESQKKGLEKTIIDLTYQRDQLISHNNYLTDEANHIYEDSEKQFQVNNDLAARIAILLPANESLLAQKADQDKKINEMNEKIENLKENINLLNASTEHLKKQFPI